MSQFSENLRTILEQQSMHESVSDYRIQFSAHLGKVAWCIHKKVLELHEQGQELLTLEAFSRFLKGHVISNGEVNFIKEEFFSR